MDDVKLETLKRNELNYLLGKIPPAFRHGVEDRKITLDIVDAEGENCSARLIVTFPIEDLDEASKNLFSDPAKRIMLASQGYSIPEASPVSAVFQVDPGSLKIRHEDTLQLAPLGKLRAGLELMYAGISQSRAEASAIEQQNANKWPPEFIEKQINECVSQKKSSEDSRKACVCKMDKLSQRYPQRDIEYQYYVKSNPYAAATGAGKYFDDVEKKIIAECG